MTRAPSGPKRARSEAKDYRSYSFWLETAGEELAPRPSLPGPVEADVAILGAGFTGLWTAYYLLAQEPSLKVVVLEAEIAGFGASGRDLPRPSPARSCTNGNPYLRSGFLYRRPGSNSPL